MKRSTFITLICSFTAAIVAIIGVMLGLIATGVINIHANTLLITSGSAKAIYDGTALTDSEWHLTKGELKEGHTLTVNVTGSQVNVGQSENYLNAIVTDENGADVTSDYNIQYKPGVLEIIARDICIIADSAKKLYDGEPLTSGEYMLQLPRQLVSTDTLEVTIEGTQTEIGSSENKITSAKIYNQFGEEVTRNYNIIEENGILIVYDENAIVISTDSDTKEYDGSKLMNGNWYLLEGELKTDHYLEVEVTGKQVGYGSSKNDFTATIYDGEGKDVTNTYVIYKECGTLLVEKCTLIIKSDSASAEFDETKTLTAPTYTISPSEFTGLIKFGEGDVQITGSQHEEGSSPNTIVLSDDVRVYSVEGSADLTHNFNVVTEEGTLTVTKKGEAVPTELVLESASSSRAFNGTALTSELCRLTSGQLKKGHKLLIEYTGSQTFVGFSDNTFNVKVVDTRFPIDENGEIITEKLVDTDDNTEYLDVTDNYIIKKKAGSLRVFPVEVVICANSAQQVYNGEPLVTEGTDFTILTSSARNNYNFGALVLGSRTNVGKGPNIINACTAYMDVINPDTGAGEQKDLYQNFIFTRVPGSLYVVEDESMLKTEVKFKSSDGEKNYDGAPLTPSNAFLSAGYTLPEGYNAKFAFDESFAITDVGKSDNVFTAKIYDADGNDVTDSEFIVTYEYGEYEVKKIPLTVVTGSKKGAYSKKDSLVCHEIDYDESSLSGILSGDSIDLNMCEFTGVQTLVGEVKNTILFDMVCNATLEDGSFAHYSQIYDVTIVEGTLEVCEYQLPDIVIKIKEINKQYNNPDKQMSVSDYLNNAVEITFKYEAGSEDVGRYTATDVLFLAKGAKTGNSLTDTLSQPGTYRSSVKEFFIWDTKNEKICAKYVYDYSQDEGNVYPLDESGNMVTSEYENETGYLFPKNDAVQNQGIVRFYRHKIRVVSGDFRGIYNGTAQGYANHYIDPSMNTVDSGHSVKISNPVGYIDVGRYENSCVTTVYNASGNNVTAEYWIVKAYGEIEILPATLTLTAASKSITFDPTNMVAVECPELAAVDGIVGLVGGDKVVLGEGAIHSEHTLIAPGEVDNIIEISLVTVTNARGNMTKNYNIVVVAGKLRILK